MFYYLILILTMGITLGAQNYINSMYKKTKEISLNRHISGKEVARKILDENGLREVKIVEVEGTLTDHYDPRNKTVNLSSDIYNNYSVASASVASHECGHALQDKEGYVFLRFRNSIVPLVNFASKAGYFIILISVLTSWLRLLWIGIIMELVILLFQLVTLPVEFNASKRAKEEIHKMGIITKEEEDGVSSMLSAAALTYVAGVLSSALQIIRLIINAERRR